MYKCENMKHFYEVLGTELLQNGEIVSPRGMETREILNASFSIEKPRERLVFNDNRKFSLIYAIVESLLLAQDASKLRYYSQFNSNISKFSDDGEELYGTYGKRVCKNLDYIISKLKEEPDSRQCICPILDTRDIQTQTKDLPCTIGLHFMIRNNKLNLHTYMRSNDIIWGTSYDVFMFTVLQEVVANTLGIDVGTYYHTASSFHVYQPYYETLEKMVSGSESIEVNVPYNLNEWRTIGDWYKDKVDGVFTDSHYCDIINTSNIFVRLIQNEFDYKRGVTEGLYPINEEWPLPFVKRWFNNG